MDGMRVSEMESNPANDGAKPRPGTLRRWIVEHDDSWTFVILYIGLAVVLSVWISLFWLVAVVGVHFVLEWMRQSELASFGPARAESLSILRRVLWELKLDISLVLFALVIGVYMEFVLGVAGLSGAARLGLQGGARLAGWERVLRGILLSVDDAAQLGRAAVLRAGNSAASQEGPPEAAADSEPSRKPDIPSSGGWSVGDRLSVALGVSCVLLLALGPVLTPHTPRSMMETILSELHPFPAPAAITDTE